MSTATIADPGLSNPHRMAIEARSLRSKGLPGPALELEILLYWANRCIRCGHPLSKQRSVRSGQGRDCAHGYVKK